MRKTILKKHCGLSVLLLALMIPGIQGCGKAGADAPEIKDRIRPVKAIRLEKPVSLTVRSFPGSAKAKREVNLAFRVGGPLVQLNGDTGDRVKKGDIVARIDPRDYTVRVKTLAAKLEASRARLTESKLQHERYVNLIRENAAAKASFDQVKAEYEMAGAQVEADMKSLEAARNALDDTVLTAPFTGFIHKKLVENYETVSQGQPIFSIVDLSTIEVEIGIPEVLIGKVDLFSEYQCAFESLPGRQFDAALKEIGKKPTPSTRTYPLTLILAPEANSLVRPGMSAEVTVSIADDDADNSYFSVPAGSVVNDGQRKTFVWIVDEETMQVGKRYVETAGFTDKGIEVRGDIHTGEWIVTAGASYLKEGQKTTILEKASETNVGNVL